MKYLIKALFLSFLLTHLPAYAAGFGDIKIHSYLGQPLAITVPVFNLADNDTENMRFTIADTSVYQAMGVDFHFSHYKLKMQAEAKGSDAVTLHITTANPINEPFVNFIVQLKSPNGTHLKEVTALLELPQH